MSNKRSLNQISSDIMLVQNSFELTEQEIDEQLDALHTELHKKENGVYWFYKNLDSKVALAKEYKSKMDEAIKKMKYTQEKLKRLYYLDSYKTSKHRFLYHVVQYAINPSAHQSLVQLIQSYSVLT